MHAAWNRVDVGKRTTEALRDASLELRAKLVVEDAERVRPELVERLLETPPPLVGREQPLDPHLRVHAVVRLFPVHLPRDTGDLRVVGCDERAEPDLVCSLVEPVARDRARPLEPAELDEGRAAVLLGLPVERELVGSGSELGGDELVERACMSDLVLRDGRERDVLLEEGRDAGPLRVPPAEDELVVGDREQEVRPLAHSSPPPGASSSVPAFSRASRSRALIE